MTTDIATRTYWLPATPIDNAIDYIHPARAAVLRGLLGKAWRSESKGWFYKVGASNIGDLFKRINSELAGVDRTLSTVATSKPQLTQKRRLEKARAAIIKCVDASSRQLVLGVVPTMNRNKSVPPRNSHTVYVHTLHGYPAVFLGDRIIRHDQQFKTSKGTTYETPTSLPHLKQQFRTARKAMIESGVLQGMGIYEFDNGWGWVSYKIRGEE